MVTSPFEWKNLEWDEKLKTNKIKPYKRPSIDQAMFDSYPSLRGTELDSMSRFSTEEMQIWPDVICN